MDWELLVGIFCVSFIVLGYIGSASKYKGVTFCQQVDEDEDDSVLTYYMLEEMEG